ncbi:hypothetical protein B0H12DRAFT_200735 [Mycena haematopus]|nr:hypothetical protein B0H12DRAFT_200735 [Mycena haematopus]
MTPRVQMPDIPMARHGALGPWVLANICAPARKVRARRYNAAMPLKFQPDCEFIEVSSKHYSFWPSQPARVREMADLDSMKVSDLLQKGKFVLWPPEGQLEARDEVEEGSTASTAVEKIPASATVLEKTMDEEQSASTAGNRHSSPTAEIVPYQTVGDKSDEEISVENMLQEVNVDL